MVGGSAIIRAMNLDWEGCLGKGANASVVPKVNFGGGAKQRAFGRKPEPMGNLPESNFNVAIGMTI